MSDIGESIYFSCCNPSNSSQCTQIVMVGYISWVVESKCLENHALWD